ncbi:PH domain-containing protein [Flavobacterium arcticum]|uniref:PH domain-containing protein n=1 Tax=Flavobacterium arcticum TaxID=1784713 RepID=A0A345HDM0_9FLAO|nr:PH domain-containing protein [Flavobacterium arcticum]AXG74680.1 PH domain-containing protein [Flavobacterium arcticum]KAF2512194.1 PH domain-containing protein [Flavobacterium arcticum]
MDTITNESNNLEDNRYINNPIDTLLLPKFEEVQLSSLQVSYYKVMLFNIGLFYLLLMLGAGCAFYFIEELQPYWYIPVAVIAFLLCVSLLISKISFKKRGFAFRTHDVVYRSGVITVNTIIIPYNRVQHVALHEGLLSRKLGLATIEIFTAGGNSSDLKIPGLEKSHAEKIKQLLVGKVLNQQPDEA